MAGECAFVAASGGFCGAARATDFFDGDAPALRLQPLVAEARPPIELASVQARNPFDPAGSPWRTSGSPAPVIASTPGQVRGIVALPGVEMALTDRGAVKPGESLDAGRLLSVKTNGAMVDTLAGPQALVFPGSSHPSLQELNQAKPLTPLQPAAQPTRQSSPPAASIQGKS